METNLTKLEMLRIGAYLKKVGLEKSRPGPYPEISAAATGGWTRRQLGNWLLLPSRLNNKEVLQVKIYLDSASVEEVRRAASWGLLSGVTTNPTLIAKEGRDFHQVIREICGLVKGPVSAEVTGTTASQMVEEARELAKISGQVVIKIPITTEGLEAVHKLKREGSTQM